MRRHDAAMEGTVSARAAEERVHITGALPSGFEGCWQSADWMINLRLQFREHELESIQALGSAVKTLMLAPAWHHRNMAANGMPPKMENGDNQ